MASTTEAAIWERVIHPDGEITAKTARAILQMRFSTEDRRRMHKLALRAQEGNLSAADAVAIENYERVGTMISVLKSKARKLLKRETGRRLYK